MTYVEWMKGLEMRWKFIVRTVFDGKASITEECSHCGFRYSRAEKDEPYPVCPECKRMTRKHIREIITCDR